MMPLGFVFKFFGLRVGHYGPKLADLLFGSTHELLLFGQHLVIGWISALPLIWFLLRDAWHGASRSASIGVGAVYGMGYYALMNALALPLFFGDALPWSMGAAVVLPSLLVHLIFGASIGLTGHGR